MPRIASLTALLCALCALVLPAVASASATQTMTFEAPRDLRDPAFRTAAMDEIGAFGVHSLRIVLYWRDVAPAADERIKPAFDETSPASYDWGQYDALIDGAKARGWSILLTVSGPVPRWATNGARDNLTRPSPALFARFVQAVGTHYGAKIDEWSVWNEPNQPQFLKPQYSPAGTALSPMVYRRLFLAAQDGLRAAGLASAPMVIGETSPRGNRHSNIVPPLAFLRGALCLSSKYKLRKGCAKLDVAGYAHHAYTTYAGPAFKPPLKDDVTIGVLSRLTTALNRAARAGAIPRHLPIYLTEFGIESKPDVLRGVSQQRQAEYRAISERIAYRNPRVVSFSQYLLRDDLPREDRTGAARYGGFESGLRTSDGVAKLSYAGFRLPLAAQRRGSKVSLWGLVRPAGAATTVTIQYTSAGRWRTLLTLSTDARGVFTHSVNFKAKREWRVVWTAPDGTVYRGPRTRAYS